MSNIKAKLMKQARSISAKLAAIEDKTWRKEAMPLVGKCFRVRNSYGTDRAWWLYQKAIQLDPQSRGFIVFRFETASDGKISIDRAEHLYGWNLFSGGKEITQSEFDLAWKELLVSLGITP